MTIDMSIEDFDRLMGATQEEAEGNARLKASAPELLEVLIKIRKMCREHPALQGLEYVDLGIQVNRAIERATGIPN
jgi:hypothetical protein